MRTSPAPRVDVHVDRATIRSALGEEARRGLSASSKVLSPKWFYDSRGSELFEQITRLPEYYPTRREREILVARAAEIPDLTGADTMVELGSGSSDKTRLLLDTLTATGQLERFVPLDVSESALRASATSIAADYPGTAVHAIVGDFGQHLAAIPDGGRRLVVFLGGTIGNLTPPQRALFLSDLASRLEPGDSLLLGTDLVKDPTRLEAAYNDSEGVTAAFNLNVLAVLNRELGAHFDLRRFSHVARFEGESEWVEMRLRSAFHQRVGIDSLGLQVHFAEGEEMLTEISAKFREESVRSELASAGLEVARWWTDPAGDFALSLSFAP